MRPAKLVLKLPVYFIGFLFVMFIFTVLNKAFWDLRVRNLCETEGGLTVYATVDLSETAYAGIPKDINGTPIIPSERTRRANDAFYVLTSTDLQVKLGGVQILEDVFEIVSSADRKSLGKSVVFIRTGGDLVTLGNPGSGFSCNDIQGFDLDLHGKIFH